MGGARASASMRDRCVGELGLIVCMLVRCTDTYGVGISDGLGLLR